LTTCWPGVRLRITSCPMDRSLTRATKSFTTLKLTSASSKAKRTSRIARSTSASVSLPRFCRLSKTDCSRDPSVSNTKSPSCNDQFARFRILAHPVRHVKPRARAKAHPPWTDGPLHAIRLSTRNQNQARAGSNWRAANRNASALSVFSHGASISSRPKCPKAAVAR